ncbi:MAG: DUF5110 domain-containing protein [Verrucomicrobia bacterium]|nr:DUF5110 domain-containing protein [Verrucomicrobiota bacterium]
MPASITFATVRFTALTSRLIRMEYAPDGSFEDRPTLTVANRPDPQGDLQVTRDGETVVLDTGAVRIRFLEDGRVPDADNLSVHFDLNGSPGHWHPGLKDTGNLHGAKRTVDSHHGNLLWNGKRMVSAGNEPGFCSRDGWVVVDDSATPVLAARADAPGGQWPEARRPDISDLYLFCHGTDYLDALRDARLLFGAQPLVPRWALGYWWSRWWAYTAPELVALVTEFEHQDLPIDVLVLDMEWHTKGWGGYDWERDLFPDPAAFLRGMRDRGLKIACNLHPSSGVAREHKQFPAMAGALELPADAEKVPFDCTDPDYMRAMFRECLHPHEDIGVDVWWLDWQQGKKSPIPGLDPLPWLNHLHWRDQQERHPGKRPLNFSRYGGPGAGRTPMGFSGDIESSWRSLQYLLRLTAESANSLFGYWSHDTGGFFCSPWEGQTSGELYLRWVQATVYQPIFRTHCAREPAGDRRFRLWGEPYGSLMSDALRKRYHLIPYLYTECRRMAEGPESLCHPLYHREPAEADAYNFPRQYGFGSRMLVAPVTQPAGKDGLAPVSFWLPEGEWIDAETGERLRGGRHRRRYTLAETPVFVRPGCILPGQGPVKRLAAGGYPELDITVFPGGGDTYTLYEDDGVSTAYEKGGFAELVIHSQSTPTTLSVSLEPMTGDFEGIRKRRPLMLRIPHTLPPAEVTRDGQPQTWHWCGERLATVIQIPEVDHDQPLSLHIRWALQTAPGTAAGLTGALRRCHLAFDVLRTACHDLLRPAGRLALTAHRIAAAPDTAGEELRQLQEGMTALARACTRAKPKVNPKFKRAAQQTEALTRAQKLLRAACGLIS